MFTSVDKAVKFLANQKKVQRLNSDRIKHQGQEGEWHNIRYSASRYPSPPPPPPVAARVPHPQPEHQTTLTQLWTPENTGSRGRSLLDSARSSFNRLYGLPPGWKAIWDEPSRSNVYANISLGRVVRNLDEVYDVKAPPDAMSSVSSQSNIRSVRSARNTSAVPTDTPRPDPIVSGVTPPTVSTANDTSLDNPLDLLSSEDEAEQLKQAALAGKAIAEDEDESTVGSENLLEDSQDLRPEYSMVETQHCYDSDANDANNGLDDKENIVPEDAFETQAAVCEPRDLVYE